MDRRRTRQGVLILVAAGVLLAAAAPFADLPLRAARWLMPAARLAALSREPGECLTKPGDAASARSIAIGRAAFRTPLLLGGQAARAGLSCASCHRNGRGNPDFLFLGISGAAGTADVTDSLFSSHRGDDIDNPKPIPDLAGPLSARKVSRDPSDPALETFIHGLITQEFDGPEPAPAVLHGVRDYVRGITPDGCTTALVPITLARTRSNIGRAIEAAEGAANVGDAAATRLLIGAARSGLGEIDERYAAPALIRQRVAIRAADRDLAAILRAMDADPARIGLRLALWRKRQPGWMKGVVASEQASLFNPEVLRSRLDAR